MDEKEYIRLILEFDKRVLEANERWKDKWCPYNSIDCKGTACVAFKSASVLEDWGPLYGPTLEVPRMFLKPPACTFREK